MFICAGPKIDAILNGYRCITEKLLLTLYPTLIYKLEHKESQLYRGRRLTAG